MYDLAILGAGSAGYAAARTAAQAKLRTVVIEGGAEVGGLCILRGCMPSKALLYAAHVLHQARSARTWGLRIGKAGFDFSAVMARKDAMVNEFARHRRKELTGGPFEFFRARAQFLNEHTLFLEPPAPAAVSHGPVHANRRRAAFPKIISAKNFIIATGSVCAPSAIAGLDEIGYLTSDTALCLSKAPESLIVLGGGPVAVELAQFFCRLDARVTLIQRSEHLLRDFDGDAAAVLAKRFRHEGMRLFSNTKLVEAFRRGNNKGIVFQHNGRLHKVLAREILFALGRIPATAGLGLERIGVRTKEGRIETNERQQTNLAHIYAAGDCSGPYQIVHIGIEQGEIAAHNIAHPAQPRSLDYRLLTNVAFTDPEVASVGLTEQEARARKIPFACAQYPLSEHGKARLMEANDGFVKLLAAPGTGEILGGTCVGPFAGDLIHEIIAAMYKRMSVFELAAMPHYHPTLAEVWTYPASQLAARIAGQRLTRRDCWALV